MTDRNESADTVCRTEGCEREATHSLRYRVKEKSSGDVYTRKFVCIPCLKSHENGMNAVVDDRRDAEVECL